MYQLKKNCLWTALTLASAVMVTACGGGSDVSTAGQAPALTVNTAAAVYAGPIAGFGSVIVNGVRFSSVEIGRASCRERV